MQLQASPFCSLECVGKDAVGFEVPTAKWSEFMHGLRERHKPEEIIAKFRQLR
jgi:hypothetical protein